MMAMLLPWLEVDVIACAPVRVSDMLTRCVAAGLMTLLMQASAAADPRWPDDRSARLAALALVETLNADLLSHDSATLTLDRWCEDHRLASPAHVVADRDLSTDKAPTDAQRLLLRVAAADAVRYRRVRLRCGAHTLSEADNFYVPGRLTPDINRQLDTTDVGVRAGRAAAALQPPHGVGPAAVATDAIGLGDGRGPPAPDPAGLAIPPYVLEHQAVLTLPDGTPFSLVIESYTGEVLGFAPPS